MRAWGRPSDLLCGGPLPDFVEIDEGARFLVDIESGQKTGFYLDQRDNRRLLRDLIERRCADARGKVTLLNLFSYSGGFALAAAHFGALYSVNVDASRPALELAERNFRLNGYDEIAHRESAEFIQADAFDYLHHLARDNRVFDFIVLDPPKLAQHKSQTQRAARGYKYLNLYAFKLVKAGGYLMTFSCSGAISRDLFTKIVFGALGRFRATGASRSPAFRQYRPSRCADISRGRIPEGTAAAGFLRRVPMMTAAST